MSIYDEKKRKSNHNDCDLDFGGHTDLYKSHSLCDNRTSIETMDGMPDIRITVSENGYIQINGKRAYPLSLKYAGKRLYVHLLGCLQDGADLQQ